MTKETILITTDVFLIGGLETHIRDYSEQFIASGSKVFLATGKKFDIALVPKGLVGKSHCLICNKEMTFKDLEHDVETLSSIIKQYGITHIQAHPFISPLASLIAAEKNNISISVVLHGPISVHGFYGTIYDYIFKFLVLPSVDLIYVVSHEVEQLVEPYCDPNKIVLQSNAIQLARAIREQKNDARKNGWLLCSRLDEDKIIGIKSFLRFFNLTPTIKTMTIMGDGNSKEELQNYVIENNLQNRVTFIGAVSDSMREMSMYEGIVGMGRVILEGISLNKPVILVGYDGIKGIVTPDNFFNFSQNNFSGRNCENIDFESLQRDLDNSLLSKSFLNIPNLFADIKLQVNKILKNIKLLKKNINIEYSILTRAYQQYHYCFSSSIEDRIFLEKSFFNLIGELILTTNEGGSSVENYNFYRAKLIDQDMQSLQKMVSYNDAYQERLNRLEERNNSLEERNNSLEERNNSLEERNNSLEERNNSLEERNNSLEKRNNSLEERNNSLEERNNSLEEKAQRIETSTSWKLTKPIRVFGDILKNFRMIMFKTLRKIYRSLPTNLRNKLWGVKRFYLNKIHKQWNATLPKEIETNKDLSWEQFCTQVLDQKSSYKGIFIQQEIIDWNVPLYQRPQHISTAMGDLDYLVIYKTYNLLGNDNVNGFREIKKNVWLTTCQEVDKIPNTVNSIYSTAYATSFINLLNSKGDQITVYEYIDHIDEEISGDQENIKRLTELKNEAFSGKADFIIASAQNLYQEAVEAIGEDRVLFVPNGVDTAHYRNPIHLQTELNSQLVEFRKSYKTIVGYFGALAPWLWYEMIEELTLLRPDIGFVYIGPDYYGGVDKLVKADNLLYLGPIDYQILPAYARQFDICFIPFKPGDIAQSTSPLKLFEYFALEKPVVVTSDMRECIVYEEVFHGASTQEINEAIDAAIAIKDDIEYRRKLAKLADENSWLERAKELTKVFN